MKAGKFGFWSLLGALLFSIAYSAIVNAELSYERSMISALSKLKVGSSKSEVLETLRQHGIHLYVDSNTGLLQDKSVSLFSYIHEEWVTHFYFSEDKKLTDVITEVHFQSDERDIRRIGG